MRRIVVIGAGVSGLTCAVRMLEAGFDVTVLTRERPSETTSSVAAALWFPFRAYPLEKVIGWSFESLKRFDALESEETGIRKTTTMEVYEDDLPPAVWRTNLPGFRELGPSEVPEPFAGGYAMDVPVVDSSRYLPFLVTRLKDLGGRIEVREISDLSSLGDSADIVINCSGTGARALAGDDSVFPIRGQVVRVPRGSFERAIVDEGSAVAAYVVPRTDDCILGTTIEEDVWDRTPSDESSREILERCIRLDARARHSKVLEARVGLRPGRPEVRLEIEQIERLTVVHNYGHGGSGFTLSWGCAEDVARLIEDHSRHLTR